MSFEADGKVGSWSRIVSHGRTLPFLHLVASPHMTGCGMVVLGDLRYWLPDPNANRYPMCRRCLVVQHTVKPEPGEEG